MNAQTLIAFLRGVMPSGKNAVKMADIRHYIGDSGIIPDHILPRL